MDYQPRHAAFSTEPQPKGGPLDADASGHAPWDCTRMSSSEVTRGVRHVCLDDLPGSVAWCTHLKCGNGPGRVGVCDPEPPPSIFDAPDAATTHARQTAQALIHECRTFASQPGHWTADQAASWIGQACAVLTELAK